MATVTDSIPFYVKKSPQRPPPSRSGPRKGHSSPSRAPFMKSQAAQLTRAAASSRSRQGSRQPRSRMNRPTERPASEGSLLSGDDSGLMVRGEGVSAAAALRSPDPNISLLGDDYASSPPRPSSHSAFAEAASPSPLPTRKPRPPSAAEARPRLSRIKLARSSRSRAPPRQSVATASTAAAPSAPSGVMHHSMPPRQPHLDNPASPVFYSSPNPHASPLSLSMQNVRTAAAAVLNASHPTRPTTAGQDSLSLRRAARGAGPPTNAPGRATHLSTAVPSGTGPTRSVSRGDNADGGASGRGGGGASRTHSGGRGGKRDRPNIDGSFPMATISEKRGDAHPRATLRSEGVDSPTRATASSAARVRATAAGVAPPTLSFTEDRHCHEEVEREASAAAAGGSRGPEEAQRSTHRAWGSPSQPRQTDLPRSGTARGAASPLPHRSGWGTAASTTRRDGRPPTSRRAVSADSRGGPAATVGGSVRNVQSAASNSRTVHSTRGGESGEEHTTARPPSRPPSSDGVRPPSQRGVRSRMRPVTAVGKADSDVAIPLIHARCATVVGRSVWVATRSGEVRAYRTGVSEMENATPLDSRRVMSHGRPSSLAAVTPKLVAGWITPPSAPEWPTFVFAGTDDGALVIFTPPRYGTRLGREDVLTGPQRGSITAITQCCDVPHAPPTADPPTGAELQWSQPTAAAAASVYGVVATASTDFSVAVWAPTARLMGAAGAATGRSLSVSARCSTPWECVRVITGARGPVRCLASSWPLMWTGADDGHIRGYLVSAMGAVGANYLEGPSALEVVLAEAREAAAVATAAAGDGDGEGREQPSSPRGPRSPRGGANASTLSPRRGAGKARDAAVAAAAAGVGEALSAGVARVSTSVAAHIQSVGGPVTALTAVGCTLMAAVEGGMVIGYVWQMGGGARAGGRGKGGGSGAGGGGRDGATVTPAFTLNCEHTLSSMGLMRETSRGPVLWAAAGAAGVLVLDTGALTVERDVSVEAERGGLLQLLTVNRVESTTVWALSRGEAPARVLHFDSTPPTLDPTDPAHARNALAAAVSSIELLRDAAQSQLLRQDEMVASTAATAAAADAKVFAAAAEVAELRAQIETLEAALNASRAKEAAAAAEVSSARQLAEKLRRESAQVMRNARERELRQSARLAAATLTRAPEVGAELDGGRGRRAGSARGVLASVRPSEGPAHQPQVRKRSRAHRQSRVSRPQSADHSLMQGLPVHHAVHSAPSSPRGGEERRDGSVPVVGTAGHSSASAAAAEAATALLRRSSVGSANGVGGGGGRRFSAGGDPSHVVAGPAAGGRGSVSAELRRGAGGGAQSREPSGERGSHTGSAAAAAGRRSSLVGPLVDADVETVTAASIAEAAKAAAAAALRLQGDGSVSGEDEVGSVSEEEGLREGGDEGGEGVGDASFPSPPIDPARALDFHGDADGEIQDDEVADDTSSGEDV